MKLIKKGAPAIEQMLRKFILKSTLTTMLMLILIYTLKDANENLFGIFRLLYKKYFL